MRPNLFAASQNIFLSRTGIRAINSGGLVGGGGTDPGTGGGTDPGTGGGGTDPGTGGGGGGTGSGSSQFFYIDFASKSTTGYNTLSSQQVSDWGPNGTKFTPGGVEHLSIVSDPEETRALEVKFEPDSSGSSDVYIPWTLPDGNHNKLWISYKFKFMPGWEDVKGGKMPGLGGGSTPTGGDYTNADGMTSRMMWRRPTNPNIQLYMYHRGQAGQYGDYFDTGQYMQINRWHTVTQEVDLGTSGVSNGTIKVYVNGILSVNLSGLQFKGPGANWDLDEFVFNSFYGGGDSSWSPSTTTKMRYAQFKVATTQAGVDLPEVTVVNQGPNAPSNFTATTRNDNSANLQWSDNSNDETNFDIQQSENGGPYTDMYTSPNNKSSVISYQLKPSTSYTYRIRSRNNDGFSEWVISNPITTQSSYFNPSGNTLQITSQYALENRQLEQVKNWHDHFGVNAYKYIGETSIDYREPQTEWRHMFDTSLKAHLFSGSKIFLWAMGQFWGDYNMGPYRWQNNELIPQGAGIVAERFLGDWADQLGVNIAGLEFGGSALESGAEHINALGRIGYKLARIPFRWERVTNKEGTSLNTSEMDKLVRMVQRCKDAGFTEIMLDMHDYGSYPHSSGEGNRIGGPNVSRTNFHDAWKRILGYNSVLRGPDIVIDLMNEPKDLLGTNDTQDVMDSAVISLRNAGYTNIISWPTTNYSGVQDALGHKTNMIDSNVIVHSHDYMEKNNDGFGTNAQSFAQQNQSAANDGYAAVRTFTFNKKT